MARFALFESDGTARRSPSSSSASTSSSSSSSSGSSSPSSTTSSSPNLNVASNRRQQPPTQSSNPSSSSSDDRHISSNPSIIVDSSSSTLESTSHLQPLQQQPQPSSMRASHSDTNLMERFRRGNFITSLVGTRKSFTLHSKRKSNKKEKKKENDNNGNELRPSSPQSERHHHRNSKDDALFPTDQSKTELKSFCPIGGDVKSQSQQTEKESVKFDLLSSASDVSSSSSSSSSADSHLMQMPNSSSDYLLHSHSMECYSQQKPSSSPPPSQLNHTDQKVSSPSSLDVSFNAKHHPRPPPSRSSAFHDQSMKKSWLYPMTFINCCLTRTDSLPDVRSDANATSSSNSSFTRGNVPQALSRSIFEDAAHHNEEQPLENSLADLPHHQEYEDDDHHLPIHESLMDERALFHNFFLRVNRRSPNLMISNPASNAAADNEAGNELVNHPLLNNNREGDAAAAALQAAVEDGAGEPGDEFQALRRLLNSHPQPPPILPILSSFNLSSSTDSDLLFPPSNYPLQMGRMFSGGGGSSRQLEQSGGNGQEWRGNVQNPMHSISNSILPYPPPSHLRSQRSHHRAHNNPVHTQIDYINCLVPGLAAISACTFYWGKMDRYEAERLLEGKPEGTFLLRDSAQEDHLFSVSFRRFDRSLHARIEQSVHRFSFDSHDPGVYSSNTVTGLIEHYKDPSHCMFFEPMLTKPLNRNTPFSLQHLARVTVCDRLTYDNINDLPLPIVLKSFLKEYHYRQKVRTKHFDEFTYQSPAYLSNYYQ